MRVRYWETKARKQLQQGIFFKIVFSVFHSLEEHSNIEDTEKLADGQEDGHQLY